MYFSFIGPAEIERSGSHLSHFSLIQSLNPILTYVNASHIAWKLIAIILSSLNRCNFLSFMSSCCLCCYFNSHRYPNFGFQSCFFCMVSLCWLSCKVFWQKQWEQCRMALSDKKDIFLSDSVGCMTPSLGVPELQKSALLNVQRADLLLVHLVVVRSSSPCPK